MRVVLSGLLIAYLCLGWIPAIFSKSTHVSLFAYLVWMGVLIATCIGYTVYLLWMVTS